MKKVIVSLALLGLTGCYAVGGGPAPYYGGTAPYYGTTYVPPYAVGEVNVGFYPHYSHVHTPEYRNAYWNHQFAAQHGGVPAGRPAPAVRGGARPAGHDDRH